jgi:hypothetical protein
VIVYLLQAPLLPLLADLAAEPLPPSMSPALVGTGPNRSTAPSHGRQSHWGRVALHFNKSDSR